MAKGHDITALARAALSADREKAIKICQCIAANEPSNSNLKTSLNRVLSTAQTTFNLSDSLPRELKGLVLSEEPKLNLVNAVLPDDVNFELETILEDQKFSDDIHEAGLPVPNRILLSGPPGNGKTTLAGALAVALDRPFFVSDFSRIISSHMGETGSNIAKLFRGVSGQPCVLLLDEMETLLSERAGNHGTTEVGEAKRIVSTLLLEIDRLPDHVLLVGATNHEEMLDRAVVRRFDFHWKLPPPSDAMVEAWRRSFAERHPSIPVATEMPDTILKGNSLSDIERDAKKWCRRWIVSKRKERGAA